MVMQLLTPVSQMIEASRAISRSQLDTPDIPLPKQPEIGQLAESFNRMKHSMAQQVSTLQEKKTRSSGSCIAKRPRRWNYRTAWSAVGCSSCAARSTRIFCSTP